MRNEPTGTCRQLDQLMRLGTITGATDSELLEQFVSGGDESAARAFEALVDRHGVMVLRVCRMILRDVHAAEDAFQATFLVLARKARQIRSSELLSNWLYGVAMRTARKARVIAARRQGREQKAVSWRASAIEEPQDDHSRADLERVLHEEIGRLPHSYRTAIVVCYLEGLSQTQAAHQLSLAESTVRGRLARARKLLETRLRRRGVVSSVAVLAAGNLAESAWPVPRALIQSTTQAAFSFVNRGQATPSVISATAHGIASGVLSTMWPNMVKSFVITSVALALLGAGTVLLAQRPAAARLPLTVKGQEQAEPAHVHPELAKLASGPIVRTLPVSRDCMVVAYLPDWNFGNVDNIGIGNNDGGVRTLVDWPAIEPDEAASLERQFLIALYSRKTISHPPAGKIHAFEILTDWPERTSWKTQPRYDVEPAATYKFEPGDGWKLFDVTSLVRARAKAGRTGRGVLLRFLNEDISDRTQEVFSDYKLVSREGAGEWADRRPLLLVVKASKPATAPLNR